MSGRVQPVTRAGSAGSVEWQNSTRNVTWTSRSHVTRSCGSGNSCSSCSCSSCSPCGCCGCKASNSCRLKSSEHRSAHHITCRCWISSDWEFGPAHLYWPASLQRDSQLQPLQSQTLQLQGPRGPARLLRSQQRLQLQPSRQTRGAGDLKWKESVDCQS